MPIKAIAFQILFSYIKFIHFHTRSTACNLLNLTLISLEFPLQYTTPPTATNSNHTSIQDSAILKFIPTMSNSQPPIHQYFQMQDIDHIICLPTGLVNQNINEPTISTLATNMSMIRAIIRMMEDTINAFHTINYRTKIDIHKVLCLNSCLAYPVLSIMPLQR